MKCEWVQGNVVLYVYDELPDDARHELEQHVARCARCMQELSSIKQFRAEMAQFPVQELNPNLLTASRMRLQEALESAEQGGWWSRFVFDPLHWLNQVRFAPALAAAIFIVGFAAGIGAGYQILKGNPSVANTPAVQPATSLGAISGVTSIAQQPNSNEVTVNYDTVAPQQMRGSLNDPAIQRLLLYAARNNFNAGVRMDSVDLLSHQPSNEHVRDALLYALRYDSNTGIRLKALDGLGPYVKDDMQVRDAVLEAVMSDANPGIRIEALHLLEPVRADSSVRIVLQRLAQKDENRYIRSQARTMLAQLPEMN